MKYMWVAVLMCTGYLCCADEPLSTDWKTEAEGLGLTPQAMTQLERDGILITNEAYKQAFSAYLGGKNPVFITSDSLLRAYHVLYKESLLHLEIVSAKRLPPFLRATIESIEKENGTPIKCTPALKAAAKKRAILVLGIALHLMDPDFRFEDPELDAILADEAERIEKAEGQRMPEWLGKSTPSFMGVDYSRYKPRGFYAKRESLARYFRALSWLHSIPFKINNDEELLSILMIGNTERQFDSVLSTDYSRFLGLPDNLDFSEADLHIHGSVISGTDVRDARAKFIERMEYTGMGRINDFEPVFSVLSAYQTPSALLFTRSTQPYIPGRHLPSGLEVAAALGSEHAENLLMPELARINGKMKPEFKHRHYPLHRKQDCYVSLHTTYLHALAALVDPPEPDAPAFMTRDAWKAKSINTLLASWSQARHMWALQAKRSEYWFGISKIPPGFVEPDPNFFARMANLAAATHYTLSKADVFEAKAGLEYYWIELERVSARLEAIAHKQLRGAVLSDMDNDFILNYGKVLGNLCFYAENSYLTPFDDTPELIDVYSNINEEKYLHVGISRPRKMYVIYPWQGKDILCEGAVLPYYEFAHPTRLNDAEWKEMLDSKKRPPILKWFQPIVDEKKLTKPTLE